MISNGRMRGDQISFTAGGAEYTGKVSGNTMEGVIKGNGGWTASRVGKPTASAPSPAKN